MICNRLETWNAGRQWRHRQQREVRGCRWRGCEWRRWSAREAAIAWVHIDGGVCNTGSKKPWWSSCTKKQADITGHQDHQPSLTHGWMSRIFSALNSSDNHLVSVLADEGKCKVWGHEENQVANKGDHLGFVWFGLQGFLFRTLRINWRSLMITSYWAQN